MNPALPSPALQFEILGAPARLADPDRLWLLLAALAVALLGGWAVARRRRALVRAAGALGARVAPTAGAARPAARLGLSTLGLVLLALALSRPQCGQRTEVVHREGVDVVLVLDASRSMRARDVAPDRFTRGQLEVGAFLDQLAGDRVGVVAFAATAQVACPLTSDAAAARLFLRGLTPEAFPQQGTALAEALRASGELLARAERGARSRAVLVVSDGEDQEGGAEAAAQALADAGIRVHALAIGTPEGAPVPLLDGRGQVAGYRQDQAGQPVVTRLDLPALTALTTRGGGAVYTLSARGLSAFRAELDRMEKTELEGRVTTAWEDRYALAAFPALLALLGALLLREARPAPAPAAGEERP
ncbi:MAG: VWA domain-containing protein [Anaeromyxobacter sp.]